MVTTLITSDHPRGRQYIALCRAVYDKAKLDESRAQRLNENGGELTAGLKKLIEQLSISNQYAGEEVASSYTYPKGYKRPKLISQQIDSLAKIFGLSLGCTSEFVDKVLPKLTLPDGAEGWFAIPSVDALASRFFPKVNDPAERYRCAVNLVLAKIGESRKFYNYHDGQITAECFRINSRTAHALDILAEQQKGDILIVAGQFGKRHAGRSVRRAREVMVGCSEFGGYTLAVGSMLLVHPERLVSYDDLWMDIPGDEFDPGADGSFGYAPDFRFNDDRVRFHMRWVRFHMRWVSRPHEHCGSVSLFLPQ